MPWTSNDRGDRAFATDLNTCSEGFGEGVFVARQGRIAAIGRCDQAAPGGGTFGAGTLGHAALNGVGDVGFTFILQPFTEPLGVNTGVYRYTARTGRLAAVVVPNVTHAPGGGQFLGALFHASLNDVGDLAFAGIVPTTEGCCNATRGTGVFRATSGGPHRQCG